MVSGGGGSAGSAQTQNSWRGRASGEKPGLAPRQPRAQPHLPQARSALREEGQNKTPQFPHLSNGDKED